MSINANHYHQRMKEIDRIDFVTDKEEYIKYLDCISIEELRKRILNVLSYDLSTKPDNVITAILRETLTFEGKLIKNLNFLTFPSETIYLFRMRAVDDKIWMNEKQYWQNPHINDKDRNRLQFEDDAFLYTSITPFGALIEVKNPRRYVESVFKNKKTLNLISLLPSYHPWYKKSVFFTDNEQRRKKTDMINDMLYSLMMNKGNDGHRLSVVVASFLFEDCLADGIIHPSTHCNKEMETNVILFRPEESVEYYYGTYYDLDHSSDKQWLKFTNGSLDLSSEALDKYNERS